MRRRKFLSLLGASALGAASVPAVGTETAGAASTQTFSGHPDAFGILHDSTLCIGCRKCEEACAKVNNLPAPSRPYDDLSVLDAKRRTDFKTYTVVNKYTAPGLDKPVFRKFQCNHCQEPACASACFVKAFKKNLDGSVTYDPNVCVGCRYCMVACPFYVPAYDYKNAWNPLVYKCTMCAPRIREGLLPGCVESCPKGALVFGRRSDMLRLAWDRINAAPALYHRHVYGEHEAGGTNWLYINPVPAEQVGFPVLGKTSTPDMTSGALGSVAIVAGMWPVLLGGIYAITKRKEKFAKADQDDAIARAVDEVRAEAAREQDAALAKLAKDNNAALAKETQKVEELEKKLAELAPKAKKKASGAKPEPKPEEDA